MTNRRRVLHARGDGQPVFRTCRKFACRADVYVYPGPDDSDQVHTNMAAVSLVVDTDGTWTVSHQPAWRPDVETPFPTTVAAGTADGPQGAVVVTVPQINNGLPTLVAFAVPLSASLAHGGGPWTFEEADAVKLGPPTVIGPNEFPGPQPVINWRDHFTPDEVENLIVTAAELLRGDAETLTAEQVRLADKAYDIFLADDADDLPHWAHEDENPAR